MLYKISIKRIIIKLNISTFIEYIIYFIKYEAISKIIVDPNTINIIVILLSFEKFLSNITAKIPTNTNPIKFIPIFFPINKSKNNPITPP